MDAQVKTRRSRGETTPLPGRRQITERTVLIWRWLNYHGPLTRRYILPHVEHLTKSDDALRVNLTKLSSKGSLLLDKPGQRFHKIGQIDHEVFANSPEIDEWLISRDLTPRRSTSLSKFNYHHETFLAHITASLQIAAEEHGVEFINEFELLKRSPNNSRTMPVEITDTAEVWDKEHNGWKLNKQTSSKSLQPDAYFAVNANGRYCAFLLEADCGSESIYKTDLDQKSWRATILKYLKIIGTKAYKKHLGLTCGILALWVFTSKSEMEAVQQLLLKLTNGKGTGFICFALWSDFNEELFVPKEVNYGLARNAWYRVGTDEDTKLPYEPLHIY